MSEENSPYGSTKLMNSLSIENAGNVQFDDIISDNAQYGRIQYWDLRYAEEHEPFEWYYGYDYFRDTIREHIPLDKRIMIAGCGSSNLLGDMVDDGYQQLVGADYSRVVLAQLKYRYRNYPQISFFQGNMTDTDLPEGSYDAIIDKALIDSLLCTQNCWITVQQYIYEVERLLNDSGVFICISHGNPELILPHIDQFDIEEPNFTPWTIEVQAVLKPKEFATEELDPSDPDSMYFVYICTKTPDLVLRKKIKLGRVAKKHLKKLKPRPKRVNMKPANSETNL